ALLQGLDVIMRMLLFWSIFLPLGACWSVDSATPTGRPPGPRVVSPGSVALIVQVCLIYFFAAAWKWSPEWRPEGTAVHSALRSEYFTTEFGYWLLEQPRLCAWLTFATVYLEAFGPVLLFLPFRPALLRTVAVVLFVGFHLGLALAMELSQFPWVCMTAWLALLPTGFWDWLGAPGPPAH